MTRCLVCDNSISSSEFYKSTQFCCISCEIFFHTVNELEKNLSDHIELKEEVKKYRQKIFTEKKPIVNVNNTEELLNLIVSLMPAENRPKSQEIPNLNNNDNWNNLIKQKMRDNRTLKELSCEFCNKNYTNFEVTMTIRCLKWNREEFCSLECQAWDTVIGVYEEKFIDSSEHLKVLNSIANFIIKERYKKLPELTRFFNMLRDRGIEPGEIEKRVWNLAADECNLFCNGLRKITRFHNDNAFVQQTANLLNKLFR